MFGLLPERIISIVVSSEQIRVIFQTILILVFFTWVIFWKSHNNISFVLRRCFALLIRRSPLSVFAPKKNARLIPRIHTVHTHVVQVEIQNEETHALAIVLNYYSHRLSLFLFHEKKQATSLNNADMYPLNIPIRTLSSVSNKNIQSKSG